jgi:hypothetical protein
MKPIYTRGRREKESREATGYGTERCGAQRREAVALRSRGIRPHRAIPRKKPEAAAEIRGGGRRLLPAVGGR